MKTFVEFHNHCIENDRRMTNAFGPGRLITGLCDGFQHNETFELVTPTDDELREMGYREYNIEYGTCFWASGSLREDHSQEYTDLRETIVLLCAAIDGELD